MCTCELMLSFVLFGWSLIAISEKAIIEKIKVLLETGDIVLVTEDLWSLGCILGVKPNKRDGLVRRVRLKTKSAVLEYPINKIILLEAPIARLHESS